MRPTLNDAIAKRGSGILLDGIFYPALPSALKSIFDQAPDGTLRITKTVYQIDAQSGEMSEAATRFRFRPHQELSKKFQEVLNILKTEENEIGSN